ncbi:hypothetical protein LCM02_02275 [Lutimonas saemankumensis]|uniref:hypothetical protein n=1 Tax=Lutimonas saemankumensis TaxID=483016 RepID=UPI001CD8036F|nr:hypothetical protein [Lutimonas saemankumensis]MCA0931260.1 hypothetical protein [Lutimonas saemankumensis]
MKRTVLSLLFGLLSYPVLMAQLSDSNTEVINQYFQVSVNETMVAKTDNVKTKPKAGAYVEIVQTGAENNIRINSLQSGDEQVITQSGQKNNYEYYNYYSNENSSMQVNQEGTLNSVQVFGENSLMKDAKINQKSDFKSIVVKNYTR